IVGHRSFGSDFVLRATLLAIIGVGADENSTTMVVRHDLVQIAPLGPAQCASMWCADKAKWMIVEIEGSDIGVWRYRVDPLLAPCSEKLQGGHPVELWIVKSRNWGRRHEIAAVHHYRIVVADRDLTEARDILVELHVHQPIIGE